jgi:hypothetical protein
MIVKAGRDLGPDAAATARRLAAGIAVWAALAIAIASLTEMNNLLLAAMLLIPLIGGTALIFWQPISGIVRAIPLHALIGLQVYRIAGAVFLYIYFVPDLLERGFALNAGWGDVLTGVLALPVAWLAYRKAPGYTMAVVAWCAVGIGDLILAMASAQIYGPGIVQLFPLNVVPIFLGPPFGILLHIVVLYRLWADAKQPAVTPATT